MGAGAVVAGLGLLEGDCVRRERNAGAGVADVRKGPGEYFESSIGPVGFDGGIGNRPTAWLRLTRSIAV